MTDQKSNHKGGGFLLGAAIGAIAGAVAGILTAPRSGKETRAKLKQDSKEVIGKIKTQGTKTAQTLKSKAQNLISSKKR